MGTKAKRADRIRMRLRLGGWICLFLFAWVFISALVTGNNFLFIILGMTLGLLVVSDRFARANLNALRCARKFPEEIYAASPFTLEYVARSAEGRWGLFTLLVIERPPLDGERSGVSVLRVRPGEAVSAAGIFSIASRGDKVIEAGVASSVFPFGLAAYSRTCCPPERVLVFPKIEPVEEHAPMSPSGVGSTVEHADPFGSVPYAFRDYVPGDPYKHIDWKKTAQTGAPITRVLGDEGAREITIRLPRDASERAISRAASLVVHFAGRGTPVGLEGPGVHVAAGVGRDFTRKVLTILARWGGPVEERLERADAEGMIVDVNASGELAWGQEGRAL